MFKHNRKIHPLKVLLTINASSKLYIIQAVLHTFNEKSNLLVGSIITLRLLNNVSETLLVKSPVLFLKNIY